jgi:hypothetical protein
MDSHVDMAIPKNFGKQEFVSSGILEFSQNYFCLFVEILFLKIIFFAHVSTFKDLYLAFP